MTDTYGFVFREVLQPAWERGVRQRPTLRHLSFLHYSEWWSLDELRAFQLAELRKLLRHAQANVPWYRRRFAEVGVSAEDVVTLEDLTKLPLLTREEAAPSLSERESEVPPRIDVRKMTSGTTGKPIEFGYDWGSEHWRNAVKLRGYGWAHYRPGDVSLHYWGSIAAIHHQPLGKRAKVALDHAVKREHFVDCTDRSDEALAQVVRTMHHLRPAVLVCYAQAGAALARHIVETGSSVPEGMSVICAAERLFPADRQVMVRAFGPDVFETYGSREVMLIAAECEAHDGMHVSMENLIVELVVRDAGRIRPAEPGETGEVVITDLHNFGAPFIRYVTGDLASALPPGRCACGRALSRLAKVDGRTNDTLRDSKGKPVSGLFFAVMFSVMADKVRQFQVLQRRDRSLVVSLVPARAFDEQVVELVRQSANKALGGVPVEVRVVPEIAVEPSGKLRIVTVEPD